MALSFSHVANGQGEYGQLKYDTWDVTWDSSYPTGGEVINPVDIGLLVITSVLPIGGNSAAGVYKFWWDTVNSKLMAFWSALGTVIGNVTVVGGGIGEAIGINPDTNAGVLSKAAATSRTIPIATFLGAAPTVAAGVMAEVANATNLSTVITRVRVEGF